MQNIEANKQITAPKKKKRASSLDRIKARSGWFFIAPFIIGFLVIYLPILIESVYWSFCDFRILSTGGFVTDFVGMDNYGKALFEDSDYVRVLIEGLQGLLFDIPAIVIFSLFMAILLNQKMTGRTIFRAIFFIPVILATGIIGRIDMGNAALTTMQDTGRQIATGSQNTVNTDTVLSALDFEWIFMSMKGISMDLIRYVIGIAENIYTIINRSGVQMLIFLGGLQSISPSIYESAYMEGASAWEAFWKITFPMISPMIFVNAVYTVIDSFTSPSNMVMIFINGVYNEPNGRTLSSAMAWIYFTIVIAALALVGLIVSSFVFYQRREH